MSQCMASSLLSSRVYHFRWSIMKELEENSSRKKSSRFWRGRPFASITLLYAANTLPPRPTGRAEAETRLEVVTHQAEATVPAAAEWALAEGTVPVAEVWVPAEAIAPAAEWDQAAVCVRAAEWALAEEA